MSELEKICEDLNENISKDFRLWLTSTPTPDFPISVLQNGIKMTMEPPKGLRNNLLKTYNNFDQKELDDCTKPDEFKRLLFGFSLFHAVILDRRKFGPIGWNIGYDFTSEDFTVCKRQLKMLLDEYPAIPFKVLQFLGAEINYGGRVTDDKDIRLITTIIKQYVCPEALRINHSFSASGLYKQPDATSLLDYLTYIQELPLDPLPEVFGLHDNAAITNA
jgi:dynein heavy chain